MSVFSIASRRSAPSLRLVSCLALLCLSSLSRAASAGTLTVPGQYATIQAAINASRSGDTVLISDGTYTGPGTSIWTLGARTSP